MYERAYRVAGHDDDALIYWPNRWDVTVNTAFRLIFYIVVVHNASIPMQSDPGSCSCSASAVIRCIASLTSVPRTELARRTCWIAALHVHTCNSLPSDVRSCRTVLTFKRTLKAICPYSLLLAANNYFGGLLSCS